MLVRIKRQENPSAKPYWQTFSYDGDKNITVGALLDRLNDSGDLLDVDGHPVKRIRWESSCRQKMCGACAMVINGIPSLACEMFLKDIKGKSLTIEPLTKFPVLSDLVVDRGIIAENLMQAETYLGEYRKMRAEDYPKLYSVARCLKCGLCLEVCPNYHRGENFFGACFANESYLLATQSADRKESLKKSYDRHFAAGCSKALSCVKVCPMGIDTITSIAGMDFRFYH